MRSPDIVCRILFATNISCLRHFCSNTFSYENRIGQPPQRFWQPPGSHRCHQGAHRPRAAFALRLRRGRARQRVLLRPPRPGLGHASRHRRQGAGLHEPGARRPLLPAGGRGIHRGDRHRAAKVRREGNERSRLRAQARAGTVPDALLRPEGGCPDGGQRERGGARCMPRSRTARWPCRSMRNNTRRGK